MSRPRDFGPGKGAGDWSGNWRTLLMLWGFPGLAMLGALGLDPTPRAVVWTFMLSAMGLACIINSRRCGRTHCRFTGPFLIVMAILVIGHTIGWLPLGRFGWPILGATTFAGFVALWSGRKRAWGMFSLDKNSDAPVGR
jgi:hypothetical protein